MKDGFGFGRLDLSMLWFNCCGLWQSLENTVDTDKFAVLGIRIHTCRSRKFAIIVLGIPGISIFELDSLTFKARMRNSYKNLGILILCSM